jgi:HPt (histidine-containing phosphotransfer) domain-containing protein
MNPLLAQNRRSDPPLDIDELSERCLGRLDLVDKVLGRFHQAMDQELEQLEQALRAADVKMIAGIAHRIKGTSLTVAAHALKDCAQQLEIAVQSDCRAGVESGVAVLREEWVRLNEMLGHRSGGAAK